VMEQRAASSQALRVRRGGRSAEWP
jgi:hypothetical protein